MLTQTDKQTLLSLVEEKPLPGEQSLRLSDNFEFFEKQIAELEGDLEPLCRGLAKLMVVDIALSRDQDNPQLIFESMNSTGRELSQADLIRNFILMGLKPERQARLYEESVAADGGELRPRNLRKTLRLLHAPLPNRAHRGDPPASARSTRRSRLTPAAPRSPSAG